MSTNTNTTSNPYAYPSLEDYKRWNQQVGPDVSSTPNSIHPPQGTTLNGHYVDLVPVTDRWISDWWENISSPSETHDKLWTYMLDGPFHNHTKESYITYMRNFIFKTHSLDLFFAIVPKIDYRTNSIIPQEERKSMGRFALIRTDVPNKSTEVGHVIFSPLVQRTPITTEPFYLLGKFVFEELHFHRWEWKCHEANLPSRRTADRFGFVHEGTFRNHYVVKGRSRHTFWFAIILEEWKDVKKAFELWLKPENFDNDGNQKVGLKEIRAAIKKQ